MTYRFLADARAEFHDAVDWYEARRAGLGDEFSDRGVRHGSNPDFPDDLGVWARDLRRNAGNPSVSDESLPE